MTSKTRNAFTLVELLVVVGTIAVLIALLVPALNRAREMAKQVQCLSNMKQLDVAFTAYLSANEGKYPRPGADVLPEDWIYWQSWRDQNQGRLVPYLGNGKTFTPEAYRCPSDDWQSHPWGYPYSYSVNFLICCYDGYIANTLGVSQIQNPSDKILIIDESYQTIDDGCWAWQWADGSGFNVLSNRHETSTDTLGDVNAGRGNVAYVDGHAAFVSRRDSWDPRYYDPKSSN